MSVEHWSSDRSNINKGEIFAIFKLLAFKRRKRKGTKSHHSEFSIMNKI